MPILVEGVVDRFCRRRLLLIRLFDLLASLGVDARDEESVSIVLHVLHVAIESVFIIRGLAIGLVGLEAHWDTGRVLMGSASHGVGVLVALQYIDIIVILKPGIGFLLLVTLIKLSIHVISVISKIS